MVSTDTTFTARGERGGRPALPLAREECRGPGSSKQLGCSVAWQTFTEQLLSDILTHSLNNDFLQQSTDPSNTADGL